MKIVAMFVYCERDKHHLKAVLDNLKWVDDIVACDNSNKSYNELKMRQAMKEIAISKGADWILELDPDERFEKNAEKIFRQITKLKSKTIYRVNFRELYTSDSYRVDGIWGQKHRYSLYPVYPDQRMKEMDFNIKTWPINPEYKKVSLDINLYHLKMIDPENRKKRVEWLKSIDPESKTQIRGYDYLLDEKGIKLETIPKGREYGY